MPQDRKRWIMVATLKPGFQIHPPQTPFTGKIGMLLDALFRFWINLKPKGLPEALNHCASTMNGTRNLDTDFALQLSIGILKKCRLLSARITKSIPARSLWKTAYGPRLLHKSEVERLMRVAISIATTMPRRLKFSAKTSRQEFSKRFYDNWRIFYPCDFGVNRN